MSLSAAHFYIIAIGKFSSSDPALALFNIYKARLGNSLSLIELEEKRQAGDMKIKREADLLLAAIPSGSVIIALDERGIMLSSEDFSKKLLHFQQHSSNHICFIIGGADGLHPSIKQKASFCLSLGLATWPHLLARVMLTEQIYRTITIDKQHPYHRSG